MLNPIQERSRDLAARQGSPFACQPRPARSGKEPGRALRRPAPPRARRGARSAREE